MIRPKMAQKIQTYQSRQNLADQGRSTSPLTQFTHFIIDDIDPPQSCRPYTQKNSIQTTSPILQDNRTPSATLSKESMSQKKNYSLSYKYLIPSAKKITKQQELSPHHQSNSIFNTRTNTSTLINDSGVKRSSMHTFASVSKKKQSKENINLQYIYGLGKGSPNKTVSQGKFIKLSIKSDDFYQKAYEQPKIIHTKVQPQTQEDDQDLYYQIVKQRNQVNAEEQSSKKPKTTNQCHNHQDKSGKYYKRDNNIIIPLCSRCAISDASQQVIIYDIENDEKVLTYYSYQISKGQEEHEKWDIRLETDDSSDQKTKVSEMQTFLYRTQHTFQIASNLLDILVSMQQKQNISIPHLISSYVMQYLKEPIQTYVDQRSSINQVPPDVMGEIQDQVNEMLQELGSIKSDINQNIQNIIKNMEMKPFRLILQKYYLKVEAFESNLNELFTALDKNFGLPNLFEMVQNLKIQISSIQQQSSKLATKQVYISFENKESFLKAKQECQSPPLIYQTNDSIILGSSDTQKFLDYLHKDAEDHNQFQSKLLTNKNILLSPNFNDNDQFD